MNPGLTVVAEGSRICAHSAANSRRTNSAVGQRGGHAAFEREREATAPPAPARPLHPEPSVVRSLCRSRVPAGGWVGQPNARGRRQGHARSGLQLFSQPAYPCPNPAPPARTTAARLDAIASAADVGLLHMEALLELVTSPASANNRVVRSAQGKTGTGAVPLPASPLFGCQAACRLRRASRSGGLTYVPLSRSASASISCLGKRRCPPRVTMWGTRPSFAHRLMVFGRREGGPPLRPPAGNPPLRFPLSWAILPSETRFPPVRASRASSAFPGTASGFSPSVRMDDSGVHLNRSRG